MIDDKISSYFFWGGVPSSLLVALAAAKSPTRLVSTDQILWHRIHVMVRKLSQDNLQMFLLQPTPMFSVQDIF